MGNINSFNIAPSFLRSSSPLKRKSQSIKHKISEDDSDDELLSPKRRKVMSTTKYIYKTLFEEGQGSDVKINALGRTWNLHRLYLSQSPYFNTMFNGLWVETTQKEIRIGIEDENITSEALHKVFGSLYQDEIQIDPSEAVSILASASLLQLDDLILQCIEVMNVSISIDTAVSFFEASDLYNLKDLRNRSLDWLHKNTLLKIVSSPIHLQQISCELMAELISSPLLIVIQSEFSIYDFLKKWVFSKENIYFRDADSLLKATENYFKEYSNSTPFLLTNTGLVYQNAFRALRLKSLITHHADLEVIESDNIFPSDWFSPIFKIQWYHMLRVDQGLDKGPCKVNKEDFEKNCVRLGRILTRDEEQCWRWTGFNFGFDIVIVFSRGCFHLRRYQRDETMSRISNRSTENFTHRPEKRHIMYQFGVYSLDKNGTVIGKIETEVKTVALAEREQTYLLSFMDEMPFPLLISGNFLQITPLHASDEKMPNVNSPNELSA